MKTAISIPDPIFESVEKLARHMGVSRSELYVKALRKYIEENRAEDVTEKLNQVYGETDGSLDSLLQNLQIASLPKGEW